MGIWPSNEEPGAADPGTINEARPGSGSRPGVEAAAFATTRRPLGMAAQHDPAPPIEILLDGAILRARMRSSGPKW